MNNFLKASLLMPALALGQTPETIRVAVIWETNEFAFADSKYGSSFMDGFYFFDQQLKKKTWTGQLGDAQDYKMEMYEFNSQMNSTKILVDFKNAIANGQDASGNVVGDYHFMIAGTAKKNKDIMKIGEELKIPNIHASGGNPAMWWEHQEGAIANGQRTTYAFGMHLPFIGYTKPIIKAAAASGYKTVAILRPHGNFFQQTSAVAAVQWALDEKLEIIGPSKEWCQTWAADYSVTCKLIGDNCRCIDPTEPVKLSKAEVVYDPNAIPTVYEIDEKKVLPAGTSRNHVYKEFVDVYKGVWADVAKQTKAKYGQDFVDVIVHWPVQYKSSLRAMKDLGLKPSFFLGWNGGVKPNWAESNYYDVATSTETSNKALEWHDGIHAFGFGQWFKTLTYSDPFFGTDVAGILKIWEADMKQDYGYDEFGACTTGIVLYLAVQKHLFKQDFVGATLQAQRDALRIAVSNVAEETLWGFVQWNKYQQNTGGGISTTVAWQLQPQGTDWSVKPASSILVLPGAFAEGPYAPKFATWDQRDGCSALNAPGSTWVVEPAQPFNDCHDCNNYGTKISSAGLFAPNTASDACSLVTCPAGNFMLTSETCTPCTPGTFNLDVNVPKCNDCPVGEYADLAGSTSCKVCTATSTTPRAGGSECVCKKGYFGMPGDGSSCTKCPAGMTTNSLDARGVDECVCSPGSYAVVTAEGITCSTKFCSEDSANTEDVGLVCSGNDGVRTNVPPTVRPGYFIQATDAAVIGQDSTIWQCLEKSSKFCPGVTKGSCGPNMKGTACVECESGYRFENDTLECIECDTTSSFLFIAILVLVFVVLPICLRPFFNTSILKQSPSTVVALTALSIIFFNIMTINSLGSYSMSWLEPLKSLIRMAGILQFDLNVIRIQCVIDAASAPVPAYTVQIVFPLVLLVFIAVLAISLFTYRKQSIDWPVILNLMGMLFSFFFVMIAVLSFYPLRCGIKHPFGNSALSNQPDVVCSMDGTYADLYSPLVGMSAFAMALYVVIYLTLVVWACWKHQSMVIGQNQFFIRSTRFLFFRWKNHCYYWTLCWHFRSFIVAVVPIMTSATGADGGNNVIQIVLLITLMAAWLMQVSQQAPWRYERLNQLDRGCTFLFVLMALAASYQTESVAAFVTVVLILFGLGVVVFIVREAYLSFTASNRPKADFYLCYHKGMAGIIARAVKFTIEYHSGASVMLGIDNNDEMTTAIDNARSCKNFVIIWTDSCSTDMFTAVEVTSAVMNQKNIAVLECDSFAEAISQARLDQVEMEWAEEAVESFTAIGLEASHVTQAYQTLGAVPCVSYNPAGSSKEREQCVRSLLEACGAKTLKVPDLCTLPENVDLFIIHDSTNGQANAAAFVLKNTMRSLNFSVATTADYTSEKFPADKLHRAQHAVVLLSNGILQNTRWVASILSLDENTKITPVMLGSDFGIPTNEQMANMAKGDLGCDQAAVAALINKESLDAAKVTARYRAFFRALALPFTPSGVTAILNAEVSNIFARVKSGKRGTTIGSVLGTK